MLPTARRVGHPNFAGIDPALNLAESRSQIRQFGSGDSRNMIVQQT